MPRRIVVFERTPLAIQTHDLIGARTRQQAKTSLSRTRDSAMVSG
jgi:hypothetical protein